MPALADWSNYFIAQAGASAGLAGLLFVALSINIERIIKSAWLPARAAVTMALLIGALVEALFALWPHQTSAITGIEECVASAGAWIFVVRSSIKAAGVPKEYVRPTIVSIALAQLASLSAIGGAVTLVMGNAGGIYALAFSMLMAIVVAFLNSWVLLVEILR